jgi:hypothetical protein
MMLTKDLIKEKLADLEKEYVGFMMKHFAGWELWAKASQRMADGEQVKEEEIPEGFVLEFKLIRAVLEMEATGKFDWNNPLLRKLFEQLAQSTFYKLWGEIITKISLRLAELAGVKTLVEIGAGRGNLTDIMLQQIAENNVPVKLIVTDASPVVLENMGKLKDRYPQVNLEILLWDINNVPSEELLEKVQPPCLSYERASIMYINIPSIENITRISDIVVFGDMFNYTGTLYAYDEISKRIGAQPLFYSNIKPLLETCLREHFMFDLRAHEELNFPNTTMLIGWK